MPAQRFETTDIHLTSGDIVHRVRIEGIVRELFDVAVLPGVLRPSAIGFKTDEVSVAGPHHRSQEWLRICCDQLNVFYQL